MKKKKTVKQEITGIHIKIDRPIEVRKQILKYAIEVAQLLKSYEDYKELHHKKDQIYSNLSDNFYEIKDLEKKLTRGHSLPTLKQLGFEEKPTEKEHIIETTQEIKIETKQIITEKPKGDSEIERLKNELKDIENQLKHL
ncbi:hypothetical protein J4436_03560 [Candidatus Woesearchaeota archaeon]|nr:hypothetical protein [Candidatus Woesearchaeota archaeon]